MKTTLSILLFIALSSFTQAQDKGTEQPANPKKILGVVMGISKYQNVPSLKYADRDALSFYDFLLSTAGGSADTNNIRLLLNDKATSYNFFEAMDNLLDMAKEGDQVYIYFAGHGDIEKKTERQNGFLIGYNAPANCYAAGGSIGVRYLQDYVETLVSKNKSKVTMIIDACRSGKLAGGSQGNEITALALQAEWKGVTKILSCQPGETSLEGEQWGGGAGVFTYFMLKGMLGQADENGDGKISAMELSSYLDKNVMKETNEKQIPEIVGDKRQEITRINKEHALALLNQMERPISLPPEKQSAGFEIDKSSIDDISILKEYEKFKYYTNNNNLIAYNDADKDKETAISIYHSLESIRAAQPVISKMKGELLAALQNRAQVSINKYMNGETSILLIVNPADSVTRFLTYCELKAAMSIADSTYPLYKQIKFRYLFYSHTLEKEADKKLKILDECVKISPNEPMVYNAMGNIKDEMNKHDEAINYYKRATELAPNWVWPWNNISMVLNKLQKFEEALKYDEKALELKPDITDTWNGKGWTLLNLGKNEESIKYFDKAIELNHDNSYAWSNKGRALGVLGKNEEAIKCLDKAIEIKPDYAYSWLNKGNFLVNIRKYEEAIKYHDKAIELKPDFAEAWNSKGLTLLNLGKYEEALKCEDKAIELKPDYAEAWDIKGMLLLSSGKNEEALKCFDKAIELKPDFAVAWGDKGVLLCDRLGKPEEAIICFDKFIELKPDIYISWANKGIAFSKLGKYEEAIKCFDKALELKPDYAEAWARKGSVLFSLGKHEEAIKCYDKAIELKPDYADAWVEKGNIFSLLGKYEEALKCYNRVIELKPDFAVAWYGKGNMLLKLGKNEEAIKCYDKALEIKPDDYNVWLSKGWACGYLKNYEEAIKCYDKLIELKPDDFTAYDGKGYYLFKAGKREEGMNSLNKALDINPGYANAWYNKACCNAMIKNKPEMLKYLKKAIELDKRCKDNAPKDEDFKEYWNDPDFMELVK